MTKKKWYILSTITVVIVASLWFVNYASKKRKEEITCSNLRKNYSSYPLNFDAIQNDSDTCYLIHNLFHVKDKLAFNAEGITIRMLETKTEEEQYRRKDEGRIIALKQEVEYQGKTITIWYSYDKKKENADIFARFLFKTKGYTIKGNIQGIYTKASDTTLSDIPDEVFENTKARILKFITTYIV